MPARFFKNPEWRYTGLLGSLLILFLVAPLLGFGWVHRQKVVGILFLIILIGGIYAISGSRRFLILAWTLMGLAQAANLVFLFHRGPVPLLFRVGLFFLFFGLVSKTILADILRPGTMTTDRIVGAICVYLLIGLVWSLIYSTLETLQPGSFRIGEELSRTIPGSDREMFSLFVYFSFVTLTTLGYGDVTPISPMARLFSFLEAVAGQLYLAVLIAALVGIHISQRMRERSS